MQRQNYKILLTIFLLTNFYTEDILAQGANSYGSLSPATAIKTPLAVFPKKGPQSIMQYKWSPNDVINIFNTNGLEVKDIKPLTADDYSSIPAKAKEAIKFIISSDHAEGCILSFERRYDMDKITDHYRTLNKKNKLYSWTFLKDNVLVVLKGEVPEVKARLYEDALKKLKK